MLRRGLDLLYLGSGWLAALSLVGIALVILAQILGRFVGVQVRSADEFAGYLLAASVFLALAPTLRAGGHIRVALAIARLPAGVRRFAELGCLVLGTVLTAVLAWAAVDMVVTSWEIDEVSQGLIPIRLWIPQTAMALGLVVLFVAMADDLVVALGGSEPAHRVAERAAETVQSIGFER